MILRIVWVLCGLSGVVPRHRGRLRPCPPRSARRWGWGIPATIAAASPSAASSPPRPAFLPDRPCGGRTYTYTSPTLSYDTLGRPTQGVDAAWYPTQRQYDSVDRPTRASDALGNLRDILYDRNGNPAG